LAKIGAPCHLYWWKLQSEVGVSLAFSHDTGTDISEIPTWTRKDQFLVFFFSSYKQRRNKTFVATNAQY
jgi:hypothetical protein